MTPTVRLNMDISGRSVVKKVVVNFDVIYQPICKYIAIKNLN